LWRRAEFEYKKALERLKTKDTHEEEPHARDRQNREMQRAREESGGRSLTRTASRADNERHSPQGGVS
jgi:hypothetical protein